MDRSHHCYPQDVKGLLSLFVVTRCDNFGRDRVTSIKSERIGSPALGRAEDIGPDRVAPKHQPARYRSLSGVFDLVVTQRLVTMQAVDTRKNRNCQRENIGSQRLEVCC